MGAVARFRDWWLGQFRKTGRLGKVAWVGVPLVFGCCFCWAALLIVVPSPDVEPTAAIAERAVATVALDATQEPAGEPATATDLPVRPPATATSLPGGASRPVVDTSQIPTKERTATPVPTTRPTRTPRPTHTPAPTELPRQATATVTRPPATSVPPTAAPPTAVPPTAVPPTAPPPTAPPQPTATLPTAGGVLRIIGVDKGAEVVTIRNEGGAPVDLGGWVLRSERGSQDCGLGGVIEPGQSLQIWAMAEDAGRGGFNCGFGSNIWNNSEHDPAVLIDPSGAEVSRW